GWRRLGEALRLRKRERGAWGRSSSGRYVEFHPHVVAVEVWDSRFRIRDPAEDHVVAGGQVGVEIRVESFVFADDAAQRVGARAADGRLVDPRHYIGRVGARGQAEQLHVVGDGAFVVDAEHVPARVHVVRNRDRVVVERNADAGGRLDGRLPRWALDDNGCEHSLECVQLVIGAHDPAHEHGVAGLEDDGGRTALAGRDAIHAADFCSDKALLFQRLYEIGGRFVTEPDDAHHVHLFAVIHQVERDRSGGDDGLGTAGNREG